MKKNLESLIEKKDEIRLKVISGLKRQIILFNLVDEGYKESDVIKILIEIDEEIKKKNYMGVYEICITCFLFMIGFLSYIAFAIRGWQIALEIMIFGLVLWLTNSPAFESKIPRNYWLALYGGRFLAGLAEIIYLWRFSGS